ncbi:hypothetical protein ACQPZ2_22680 [Nocardia pseudovaccinii]|uniref:hypothetical protein n=1 Tax=Nocardia pseudovaccinii TaxID=189540 RepID=UPI003D8CC1A5
MAGQPDSSSADSWWRRASVLGRSPGFDGRAAPIGQQAVHAGMPNPAALRGEIISEGACRLVGRGYMPEPVGGAEV